MEDTGRRWRSGSQGQRPRRKPTLLTPWSWTSGLQNLKRINVCCLSHLVCGTLLWWPQPIHTAFLSCPLSLYKAQTHGFSQHSTSEPYVCPDWYRPLPHTTLLLLVNLLPSFTGLPPSHVYSCPYPKLEVILEIFPRRPPPPPRPHPHSESRTSCSTSRDISQIPVSMSIPIRVTYNLELYYCYLENGF